MKYIEYFVVYFMVVNNLGDRPQVWRLVTAAFLTAVIVSLIGASQIPSGERVSAPFEGKEGEPNTLGGYLLLMLAIAGGIALETTRIRVRAVCLGLVALMGLPFAYTLSRASFLGVPFVLGALAAFSTRRRVVILALLLAVVASPLTLTFLPTPVVNRLLYTFQPETGQATVKLGRVAFDPSTSARLISFQSALAGWVKHPFLGYGVTGFAFMDAQYARTLVETGIIGLGAFLWLAWSVFRGGVGSIRSLADGDERGLALGFVAGLVGLLVHAIGANTFIIVRIMEPFWFFAAVVIALPVLAAQETAAPARPLRPVRPARRVA